MAIKQLSNKIELSFWHLTISLLTDSHLFRQTIKWGYSYFHGIENWEKIKQRINWVILGTSTVLSIIVIGVISYLFLGVLNKASHQLMAPLSKPTNGQKNILVIGVDDLESEVPRLVGVWLLIYFPEKPNITFAPIFPDPLGSFISANSGFIESFTLDEDDSPSHTFVDQLHQKDLWWHGYIVIDSYAVAEAVEFFNQVSEEEKTVGNKSFYSTSWADEFPPGIAAQTDLLNKLCKQAATLSDETDISRILALVPTHFSTDMSMITIIQDWHSLISPVTNLVCEFPIQKASNP